MTDRLRRIADRLSSLTGSQVLEQHPLAAWTTFGIGGPADVLFLPADEQALQQALLLADAERCPIQLIGHGSNILVSDRGVRGLTIALDTRLAICRVTGTQLIASAGCSLAKAASVAAAAGLSGLEFAAGIPGSVGGGLMMNAGAYDHALEEVARSTRYLNRQRELAEVRGAEHEFGYRTSCFAENGGIVLETEFVLQPADRTVIYQKMADLACRRRHSQPLNHASAGSAFKRPDGNFAGKLISDCGLKGFTMGKAGVSAKHAGFIVNYGGATAAEVAAVFRHVRRAVWDQFGILLEPEVRLVGDWGEESETWKSSF